LSQTNARFRISLQYGIGDVGYRRKLKQSLDWEEIRLIQDSKKTFFTSEERYNTGATLYYIPVVRHFVVERPKAKTTAQLLISVCSYLYHIADIPYYRQEAAICIGCTK
jgi:hypothetical protein